MNEDYDGFKQSVVDALTEAHKRFEHLSEGLTQALVDHKQTVNRALNMLSKELLDFIDKDAKERRTRQKRQDIKDIAIGCFLCLTLALGCSIIAMLIYILIGAGYVIR